MKLQSSSVLVGALAGIAIAVPATLLTARAWLTPLDVPEVKPQTPAAKAPPPAKRRPPHRESFAQHGEDLILAGVLAHLGIRRPTYLDIGAHDPIRLNNTYYFYLRGSRGTLVEPNPAMADKLKRVRPEDTVLNVGIGPGGESSAPYYIIGGKGGSALNTFEKAVAESYGKKTRGFHFIAKTITMPLVDINRVIAENFKGAPNLLSVDVEGLDLAILKSLDFDKYKPDTICVETVEFASKPIVQATMDFLRSKGYAVRGGSFVNTIFVPKEKLVD